MELTVRPILQKLKGPEIYIPSLAEQPKQQQATIQTDVLTSTSSRWRGAISGRPMPEQTTFGPTVAARQTHLCPIQLYYGLHLTGLAADLDRKWRAMRNVSCEILHAVLMSCSLYSE